MKKLIYTLLLVFVAMVSKAQIAPAELIGRWKVTKVLHAQNGPRVDPARFEELARNFRAAVFSFSADQSFAFSIPIRELAIPKGVWALGKAPGSIEIRENRLVSSEMLMGFAARKQGGKWFFVLDEAPVVLEVAHL